MKVLTLIVLSILLLVYNVITNEIECGSNEQARIVGGYEATVGDWPWMVSLRTQGYPRHLCGGVLIHRRYVLTAGHCTFMFLPTQYEVHIGLHNSSDNNHFISRVKKIYRHPNYTSTVDTSQRIFDFAVLELVTDTNNTFPVICLPSLVDDLNYDPTKNTTVLGWGRTSVDSPDLAESLQEATLVLLNGSSTECVNPPQGHLIENSSLQLCAGRLEGGIGTCGSDSGGPLMARSIHDNRWYLIGITSYAWNCALPSSPTIFLRVSAYISWMEKNIPDMFDFQSSTTSITTRTTTTTTLRSDSSSFSSSNVTSNANMIHRIHRSEIVYDVLKCPIFLLALSRVKMFLLSIYK